MCWQRLLIVLVIILALNNSQMRKEKGKKGDYSFVEKLEILVFPTIFKGMNALATRLPMFITK